MDLNKEKKINKILLAKFCLISIFCKLAAGPKECLALQPNYNKYNEIKNHNGENTFFSKKIYGVQEIPINKSNESTEPSRSCRYFKSSSRLICNGSIDFSHLKTLQSEQIADFVVENYEAESIYRKKYWSTAKLQTGEWYTILPKIYNKLTGTIQLKDTGIHISVILNLVPRRNSTTSFIIDGEAFSNKIVKVSWRLGGELSLNFIKNRTIISVNVGKIGNASNWKLQSNLTFAKRNDDGDVDEWQAYGIVSSDYISENLLIFKGVLSTIMMKGECRFWGDMNAQNVNLVGTVIGSVSPPQNKQVTIPKSAFSNMTVKNIVFKDSKFFNDFEKNSFEGIKGTVTIAFIDSKLELMPKLNELFQHLLDLKEIYIEDCITSSLKFGSISSLTKIEKISFKGSGPLLFDDTSFLWLGNSNLTHLNLRHSHVKLAVKGKSVLWSVNNTLRHLDLSYSTLTEEKDLTLILSNLKISHLAAEGLHLRKIPTSALSNVRNTLEYLSLRGSNFNKIFEKNMFSNVFNFPLMTKLKELNLVECHINYIERGSFDNLPNLQTLNLAYNNFENLQDGWTSIKPQITNLDLSNNGLTFQEIPMAISDVGLTMNFSMFENLRVLDLSNGVFTNLTKIIDSLGHNLRNLSLSNTGLEELPESIFKNLNRLEILDVSFNKNFKGVQTFSFEVFRHLKNLKALDLKHCRITGSAPLNDHTLGKHDSHNYTFDKLMYIDLSFNNIKTLDFETLKLFPRLHILNLSGNSMSMWKENYFRFNKYLEAVFLDENRFQTISNDMLSDISNLKYVKLGNNPFICGPFVYDILKMIDRTQGNNEQYNELVTSILLNDINTLKKTEDLITVQEKNYFSFIRETLHNFVSREKNYTVDGHGVHYIDWSDYNYMCFSWSQNRFIPFSWVNETFDYLPEEKTVVVVKFLWLAVVTVAGLVITIGIICWKWIDVHLITRAVRNAVALSFLSRGEKEPAKYDYHAFISYCEKDRTWVIENLLPRLETWTDVKVCLHERDFQVGLSIMENIIASIDGSKNIILIISQAFLKSQWCQYEMHLAQHRLLEKGRDNLLLIFLENIPFVQRPKTLRFLMMTKTYMQWPVKPKSHKEIELFWDRLLKSLLKLN